MHRCHGPTLILIKIETFFVSQNFILGICQHFRDKTFQFIKSTTQNQRFNSHRRNLSTILIKKQKINVIINNMGVRGSKATIFKEHFWSGYWVVQPQNYNYCVFYQVCLVMVGWRDRFDQFQTDKDNKSCDKAT